MNTVVCGSCGAGNPVVAKFCMSCGAPATATAPAGLRFVTVVFCDIAGSTQMALRFDPQVWHGILEAYFAEVGGALTAAGGRLEKFIGDAVVGVFGADASGEDDAIRAVRGALDALRRLGIRNDESISRHGIRLSIRFGIASGRVVMAQRDSSFAIGSVMNRAARLQSAAAADAAVVDVRTWLLIREQVSCRPVDPVPAKGFARPLLAWSVSAGTAMPSGPAFVNQHDLLADLTSAVSGSLSRPGVSTIRLEGDVGSGKSRVLRRLDELLAGQQIRTLHIGCRRDEAQQATWRLQQVERELTGDSAPFRGAPAARVPANGAPAPSTVELVWRIRQRLAGLSRHRPIAILIDDYHRASEALRALFSMEDFEPGSVALVYTAVPPGHPSATDLPDAGRPQPGLNQPPTQTLRVAPLSADDSRILLAELGGDIELHSYDSATESLIQRARGNPLFLEQLAALAAEGIEDEVAPTAEAVLGTRIDRLATSTRHVLGCLGASGRDADPRELEAITGLDEAAVAAALSELESAGLLWHRAAAEVAYGRMVLGDRATVHTALARLLREQASDDPALLEPAVAHASRAQRHRHELDPGSAEDGRATRLAAQCLIAAARYAIARSDVRPAAQLAAQARALQVPEPETSLEIAALESYALAAGGQVPEALARIDAVAGLTGNPSATVHLSVTELVLRGSHDGVRDLVRSVGDPGAQARLETWEGLQAARIGDYPRAEALLSSAYAAMPGFRAGLGVAEIYGNLSLFLALGETPTELAAARCQRLRDELAGAPILHAVVSCSTALLAQLSGQPDRAQAILDEATAVFSGVGHVIGQAGALEFRATAAELAGNVTGAHAAAVAAQQVYAAAGARSMAARCEMRAYMLDPAGPAPDLSDVDYEAGWETAVLWHQVLALHDKGLPSARRHLAQAQRLATAVRGRARLAPLAACHRIEAHLSRA